MSDTTQTAMTVANDAPPRPAVVKAPLTAGSTPRAIVPVDFDGAYRIANVVVTAGMAPKTLQSVEKAMVAILHGLEVGLTPMNALQSIAVINGRPTIWGDGAIGLIRASGLLEYMKEYYENEDDPLKMKAVCVVKRKGEPEPVRGDFSMADAKKAGLLSKEGPWQTYPKRMLKMRARWPLRDTFADVLKGLALKEEVEDRSGRRPSRAAWLRRRQRRRQRPPRRRRSPTSHGARRRRRRRPRRRRLRLKRRRHSTPRNGSKASIMRSPAARTPCRSPRSRSG
jgi:hypothetical protein